MGRPGIRNTHKPNGTDNAQYNAHQNMERAVPSMPTELPVLSARNPPIVVPKTLDKRTIAEKPKFASTMRNS